jgi:hypothetical protein
MTLGMHFSILLCQINRHYRDGEPFPWHRKHAGQKPFRSTFGIKWHSSEWIRQVLLCCPGKSLRKHSLHSGLFYRNVRNAKKILKLHRYHVHVMYELMNSLHQTRGKNWMHASLNAVGISSTWHCLLFSDFSAIYFLTEYIPGMGCLSFRSSCAYGHTGEGTCLHSWYWLNRVAHSTVSCVLCSLPSAWDVVRVIHRQWISTYVPTNKKNISVRIKIATTVAALQSVTIQRRLGNDPQHLAGRRSVLEGRPIMVFADRPLCVTFLHWRLSLFIIPGILCPWLILANLNDASSAG